MNPRKQKLKSLLKVIMYDREEKGMTHGMTLFISGRLDRRLVDITLGVREHVLIQIEKVVFS